MSKVGRFLPKSDRIGKAKADTARQAILDLGLPDGATESMMVVIHRHETGGLSNWSFNMINPQQYLLICEAIDCLPGEKRPHLVRRVFDYVFTHIEPNTNIVTMTRQEIAVKVKARPQEVSSAMTTLESLEVIFRELKKVPGMRGRGVAQYRLNQWVGWNGRLEIRAKQAEQVPLPFTNFGVINGGLSGK